MMGQEHSGWSALCLQDNIHHQSIHCKKVTFSNISIAPSTSASTISGSYSTCTHFSAIALISDFVKDPSLTSYHFRP